MKKSRFTEEQIVAALRQAESGTPAVELCRKLGVTEQTFYRWKRKFAGMGIVELRRLRQVEEEKRKISERLVSVRRAQANRGKYVGSHAPYGYQRESIRVVPQADGSEAVRPTGNLVFHPIEQPIITEIYTRLDAGDALFAICVDLNQRGIRPKRGTAWHVTALRRMVQNPLYCGDITLHGNRYPGIHEPIVSRDLWQRGNDRIIDTAAVRHHSPNDLTSWCEGHVEHACGRRLYLMPIRGKVRQDGSRTLYPNFFCGSQYSPVRCSIMPRAISALKMETVVRACFIADLATISTVDEAIAHAADVAGGDLTASKRHHLDDRRRLAERRYQRVREGWLASDDPTSWLDAETVKYQADLAAIDAELAALPSSPEPERYADVALSLQSVANLVEMLPDEEVGKWLGEMGTAILSSRGVSIRYKAVYRDFVSAPAVIVPPRRV